MVKTVSMVFAFVESSPVLVVSTEDMDVAVVTLGSVMSHGSLASPGVFASLIAVEHGSIDTHVVHKGPVISSEIKVHSSVFFWDKVLGNTISRDIIWHPLVSVDFVPLSGIISW